MARKQSGGRFNRILEFIGLVDDEDPRDSDDLLGDSGYGRESYGRGSTYNPPNARNTRSSGTVRRTNSSRRTEAYVPAYTGSTPRRRVSLYAQDDDLDLRRGSRAADRPDYGARPNPAMSRTSSAARSSRYARATRFTEDALPEDRQPASGVPVPRESRVPSQQRMVMLSMQRLEDCCDVIDHLIAGNMVLLTLDDMDIKLYQRVVDTLSGSVYALKAKIRKASERTYLVAPGSVDIDDAEYVARSF